VGSEDDVIKLTKKHAPVMIPLAQNPPNKLKFLRVAKVCPERANYAFSEKFSIRPKTGFLTHIFGNRYASKLINGSIDTDFDLVFN